MYALIEEDGECVPVEKTYRCLQCACRACTLAGSGNPWIERMLNLGASVGMLDQVVRQSDPSVASSLKGTVAVGVLVMASTVKQEFRLFCRQ